MLLGSDGDRMAAVDLAHPRGCTAPARGRATPARWTVLAYLAGDNNLEGSLLGNLRAMERIGSRPGSIEILAQIDRARGYDAADGD